MLLLTLFSTLKKPIYCCRQRIPIRNSNLKLNMEKARKFMLFLLKIRYYFYYVHPQVLLSFYLYTKDWYGLFNIFFIILFISYTFTYAFYLLLLLFIKVILEIAVDFTYHIFFYFLTIILFYSSGLFFSLPRIAFQVITIKTNDNVYQKQNRIVDTFIFSWS